MKKEIVSVAGMTCASCAKAVERGVGKIEEVHSASVNFATEKLNVEFEESQVDILKTNDVDIDTISRLSLVKIVPVSFFVLLVAF